VDGVITEDNDVFLFGARRVYKSLFDERRNVEYYQMDDVEGEVQQKNTRRKMLGGRGYT
jgi:DNA excision repair protein ERCC-5